MSKIKYIIGIDEAGRGPLAGPVTVCALTCEEKLYLKLKRDKSLPVAGKDSKKLSPKARQKYFAYLNSLKLSYEVTNVSNEVIDEKGISFSVKKAINECLKKSVCKYSQKNIIRHSLFNILLDGGLKAPMEFKNQRTIIKGDEKEKIISWASIIAKVSRDNLMDNLSKKYPQYGLNIHKGYGTKKHREAIEKHGLSKIHRKTYCKNVINNYSNF